MKLDEIGFYTLSEARCAQASHTSPLWRCELVLSARCNFRCPYCRHVGGRDLSYADAVATLAWWTTEGLRHVRFSGGEPTLYPRLEELVGEARRLGVQRIALSTNGSASVTLYAALLKAGVSDVSVSLDACCAEDGDLMAGGVKGAWEVVVSNIRWLAARVYTTVGIVLTEQNLPQANETIQFAHALGVQDIRVIPAAQEGAKLDAVHVDGYLLSAHPILRYRIERMRACAPVRGLQPSDAARCGLVVDDMAVMGTQHYPCIIYLRERGKPIGTVGPHMREERRHWAETHDTHADPICVKNCLDVCVQYNNRFAGRLITALLEIAR